MKRKTAILLIAALLGIVYGLISAHQNQNPYDRETVQSWHWQPSPVWLPSYLVCQVAKQTEWAGIKYTKSGLLFPGWSDRCFYFAFSAVLGGVTGLLIGGIVTSILKKQETEKPVEVAHKY